MDPVTTANVIGAGISGGTNLVSGLLGLLSQKSANKTNLAIARETSAANERINQANIDYSWKALQEQQRYASFGNQIEMAKAAGVNPYLAIGNPVTGGSAVTPVSHAMQASQVQPENAFATALGRASQDAANMVATIAQARKADAETQGIKTDNLYRAAQQEADLNLKGLQGAAINLRNEFDAQNNPLLLRAQELNNEYLNKQISLAQIESDIKTYYKDKIQPQELEQILAEIQLLKERKQTEISQQELNKLLGRAHVTSAAAAMINAHVNQYLAPHQAQQMDTQANLNNQMAAVQQQEASIKRVFGGKIADAMLHHLQNGNVIDDATLTKIYTENRILQKEYDMSTFKSIIGALIPIGAVAKFFGIGTSPLHISGFGQ